MRTARLRICASVQAPLRFYNCGMRAVRSVWAWMNCAGLGRSALAIRFDCKRKSSRSVHRDQNQTAELFASATSRPIRMARWSKYFSLQCSCVDEPHTKSRCSHGPMGRPIGSSNGPQGRGYNGRASRRSKGFPLPAQLHLIPSHAALCAGIPCSRDGHRELVHAFGIVR